MAFFCSGGGKKPIICLGSKSMSKSQANRLRMQHIKSGGGGGTFGKAAKKHDSAVGRATKIVFEHLKTVFPEFKFRHRSEIEKKEINKALKTVDKRLGKTLFVAEARIKPDGGVIEVQDTAKKWRIVLVAEAKHQGKDVDNLRAGLKVGKNEDQDLMVAGNAIERVHKNIQEIRNMMLHEKHFPYMVFLQGSNFATERLVVRTPDGRKVEILPNAGAMNRIDRVTAASYSMPINTNCCKNIEVALGQSRVLLQAVSIYARCAPWKQDEMVKEMLSVTETALDVLWDQL